MYISKADFNKSNYKRFVVVGDIGGTHTYIAIMGVITNKSFDIIFKDSYLTSKIKAIDLAINDTLKYAKEEYDIEVNIGCFGVAGPVPSKREEVKLTNADMSIKSFDILSNTLLNKFILINDFEAIGYGIDLIDISKDAIYLPHTNKNKTVSTTRNTFAVIGAGTGLGVSIAPYNRTHHLHVPLPSEGGHIDFTPYNELEMDLVSYLKENSLSDKRSWPDYEKVLSGKGLEDIFNFLVKKKGKHSEITTKIMNMKGVEKLTEIEANYENDEICRETIDLFVSFYARAARNIAMISECYSGLFISGRIALKNINKFKETYFMDEFEKHDKHSDILKKIPVYIITNNDVGLYGCCNVAVNFLAYNLIS